MVANRNERKMRSSVTAAVMITVGFAVFAFGGSFFVSHQMNKSADIHAGSAGRPGDPMPNRINEHPASDARGAPAGSNPGAATR